MDYDAVMQHFGSRYQLSRALGLKPTSAYQWPKGHIPTKHHQRIRELMEAPPCDTIHAPSASQPTA